MKFAAAYYLLLIYSMVILKPLVPVVEDALFHCFAEAYHIATTHSVQGEDHAKKEMAASGAEDNSAKNVKTDKAEQTFHETVIDYTLNLLYPYPLFSNFHFLNTSLSTIYIAFTSPPPRLVV